MAVHSYIPGFETNLLFIISVVISVAGIISLFYQWGDGKPGYFISSWRKEAFRDGIYRFIHVLFYEVLLFRRVWRRSKYRWLGHMAMFWSFLFLGIFLIISLMTLILAAFDPDGFGGTAAKAVAELRLPYDLLGYLVLAVCLSAILRRVIFRKIRERTIIRDYFMIISVFIITLTGMTAEWYSGYGTFIGKTFLNWDSALMALQWHLYTVFILFIMVIPWSRFKHIITVPLLLLARRGGE